MQDQRHTAMTRVLAEGDDKAGGLRQFDHRLATDDLARHRQQGNSCAKLKLPPKATGQG
jgi:hypothetical protein